MVPMSRAILPRSVPWTTLPVSPNTTPLHVGREPLLKSVDPSCNRLHKRTQSRANVPRKERK
jgi:hypothetical protein